MVFQEKYVKVATTVSNSLRNLRSCAHADQANSIRFKRGKKGLESPSVTEEHQQKRDKLDGHDDNERSKARQCLQLQSAATQPKECRERLPECYQNSCNQRQLLSHPREC